MFLSHVQINLQLHILYFYFNVKDVCAPYYYWVLIRCKYDILRSNE